MADFTDEFNEHSDALRREATAQDFADLQDAIAGRNSGRHRKHIHNNEIDPLTGEKRKSVSDIVRETLDWLLLNNPEYARIHGEAMGALRRVEDTAGSALDKTIEAVKTARAELQDMLDRAPTLPDGRKVFRDGSTGHVYDADGLRISDDLAAGIEWAEGAADNRDYIPKKQSIEELEQSERELRGIQTELGGIRGELTNNEKPPTPGRVETLKDRIGELQDRAAEATPQNIQAADDFRSTISVQNSGSANTPIPVMPKK